ncbi:hypothetical protein R1sor_015495 [Riccia sorocarpa]|uniref:Uncharacterized protein n=1 Tax=Riccia sorocarpa TaxID=122646 RepID=A0ABD3HGL0_9MARC
MAAQAGASLHFELYTEDDDVNYIRWKWISKKEAHRVLRGIDGRLLRRSGLHDALWMDWARPEEGTTSVREFVLNWDDRTQSSTVGGRKIPLTIDTIREYFFAARRLEPPVKPLEVTGAFLYILKNKVGHADEDENLDWATYFKKKVREEIRACKKQMQASRKRKVRPTCIDIVVLHILRTCGIVDDEDIVLNDSDKSVEEVTPPRFARAASVHVQSSSSSPDRVQDPSSNSPDRVHDPSSSSPEQVHVSSPSSPERGPDRGHLSPDPRDVSSSSSPGRTSGSPGSPDRGEPADNEPLTGFGSPMVPYPASEDDEEGAIEWAIKGLTSLGAADLTTIAKGKRPVLHKSSSESKEIRFARPDHVKRRVAVTEDEAGGPVSQQAEVERLTALVNEN